MPFTVKDWQDAPSTATPLNAAALEDMEQRLSARHHLAGALSIATEHTTTSTSYTVLSTPDRVDDVVLPTDGFIAVMFWALIAGDAVSANARAAIFLNDDQAVISSPSANAVQEAPGNSQGGFAPLVSQAGIGLNTLTNQGTSYANPATTGQIVGGGGFEGAGPVYLFAAAGTYDISIRFKTAASGQAVYVKHRKLWVWVAA